MIHLDTNFLVAAADPASPVSLKLESWLAAGEEVATSSIAWTEFLSGPLTTDQIENATDLIEDRVVAFGLPEAILAADLFNRTGRRRGERIDCLIAACALRHKAALATENRRDFRPYVAAGLRLL